MTSRVVDDEVYWLTDLPRRCEARHLFVSRRESAGTFTVWQDWPGTGCDSPDLGYVTSSYNGFVYVWNSIGVLEWFEGSYKTFHGSFMLWLGLILTETDFSSEL